MSPPTVWIITGNLAERRLLEAILRQQITRGDVAVEDQMIRSAAIGVAKLSLLQDPNQSIALVLNAETIDPMQVEDQRGTLQRILADCSPRGWHVALATPHLAAWALADPRIREAFAARPETDPAGLGGPHWKMTYINQAAAIGHLVRDEPFDTAALRAAFPDFRHLDDYISRCVAEERAAAGAAAS